jgi:type IV secretory pathway component VirB8
MSSDEEILSESIRSGKYFENSRGWFQAMYIGPVSERTFFLVVAILSALVAFASIAALMSMMPITERRGLLIRAGERMDETVKTLVPLRESRAPLNPALVDFFVTRYVQTRESYFVSSYLSHASYIRQQSDDAAYAAYIAQNDVANPASPAATLGEVGQRVLTIHEVDVDKNAATVKFTTQNVGMTEENKTRWTARMEFRYTPMDVGEKTNAETGELELTTTDPKFQVVKYELEQK